MTGFAFPSIFTLANEIIHQIDAPTSILAGIRIAIVVVDVAEFSPPAAQTKAFKGVDFVGARAAVSTRIAVAVVYVFMAIGTSEASIAGTGEIPTRQANATSVRPADIRGDVTDIFLGGISRNRYCTAVYDFTQAIFAVVFKMRTVLAIVVV